MSKTYDKIRRFQERREKKTSAANETSCNKYVSDLLGQKGSVSAGSDTPAKPVSFHVAAGPKISKMAVLFLAAVLFIALETLLFYRSVKESRSERIQLFQRLNSVERELAEARGEQQGVAKKLKDSELKFLTLNQKLDASEARVKTLERQIEEQKAKILSLTAAAQASSQTP